MLYGKIVKGMPCITWQDKHRVNYMRLIDYARLVDEGYFETSVSFPYPAKREECTCHAKK